MKVIIFGAGKKCNKFLRTCRFLSYMEILFIADSDEGKWGTEIEGYKINSPEKIKGEMFDKILVTTHFEDIQKLLVSEYSIPKEKITPVEYLIVPELCNMGGVTLKCDLDQLCDIAQLGKKEIVTSNPLEEFFFFEKHRTINKWWHYFEIYHEYFRKYRKRSIRMLEIGVYKGGSLQMWKNYFGNESVIVGIDIDESCKQYEENNIHVCIGSQDNVDFLKEVCEKYGPFDIILDDGSHQVKHQIDSFETLFPLLNYGGIYLCEDTHTSYWAPFGGELRGEGTFIEHAKKIIDELHYQHIEEAEDALSPNIRDQIKAIHFYNSIVVFEKEKTGLTIWSMNAR